MEDVISVVKRMLRDVVSFCQHASGIRLRSYQIAVARAILDSVVNKHGRTFVVVFPRQSGKNELQAQLEAYLLTLYSQLDAELVKVSPTWKPQTLNAMRRLERVLARNLITRGRWTKESGYVFRLGRARCTFLSGSPSASVVGATANLLLQCDEAQDIAPDKWDKDFAPMAASTNATRVFWGTTWTSKTLLARELRAAQQAEKEDGVQRVFKLSADEVAGEVEAYGRFVREQVLKLGRNHPVVKTQFFSEEVDAEGGMFPPQRIALLRGDHAPEEAPCAGAVYALLVDVAGEDEAGASETSLAGLAQSRRDSTALTVVRVDLSSLDDELVRAPTYRVVHRRAWTGVKHTSLYAQLKAAVEHWGARYTVIDATGVGAGLASFLEKAFPARVVPFIFTAKSKSELGWRFLALIETGRLKDFSLQGVAPAPFHAQQRVLQELFFTQAGQCASSVLVGPGKALRWGVPEGTRLAQGGELVHDDLLLSAALAGALDEQAWGLAASEIVHHDALAGMQEVF
ncbi:MAG: hypothetical protein PHD58_02750 [Anaerolineales bacterium]|nr:hypothetical protein [Anaerolineales bacterium]